MTNRIYVYLARRDKKGILMISSFASSTFCYPTKINLKDLSKIQLPKKVQDKIILEFNKNNMIYEIYIESASSADEFKKSLISRGYKNIPRQQISMSINNNSKINEEFLITKKNIMIRRNSDQAKRM